MRSILVQTESIGHIGVHEIRIRGSIIRNTTTVVAASLTFRIQVVDAERSRNTAPYFQSKPSDIRMFNDEYLEI